MALALSIALSTGLRHRLVQQYEARDHTIVHSAIAAAITQYTGYCHHITTFLISPIQSEVISLPTLTQVVCNRKYRLCCPAQSFG